MDKLESVFVPTRLEKGWLEKIPKADAVIVLGSGLKKKEGRNIDR